MAESEDKKRGLWDRMTALFSKKDKKDEPQVQAASEGEPTVDPPP